MKTDNETELKPCPFCGGKASSNGESAFCENHQAWWGDGTQIRKSFNVHCVICGSSTKGISGQQTKEKAILKWNTRPEPTLKSSEGLVELCKWLDCKVHDLYFGNIEPEDIIKHILSTITPTPETARNHEK